jgi:serine/threonine protein kinase
MSNFSGEIIKGYKLCKEQADFKAGQNNLWTVQSAVRTSDNKKCSIMHVSKPEIASLFPNTSDNIWQILQSEAKNLLKLKHPSLLSVIDKVYEENDKLFLVVERITHSLATIFQEIYTISAEFQGEFWDKFSDEDELKINMKSLLEGVKFINKDLQNCHFGLSPENIFIEENSQKWKIGGFGLMRNFGKINLDELYIKPNMYFISPEHFSELNNRTDLFCLGLILSKYFLYNYHMTNSNFLTTQN